MIGLSILCGYILSLLPAWAVIEVEQAYRIAKDGDEWWESGWIIDGGKWVWQSKPLGVLLWPITLLVWVVALLLKLARRAGENLALDREVRLHAVELMMGGHRDPPRCKMCGQIYIEGDKEAA